MKLVTAFDGKIYFNFFLFLQFILIFDILLLFLDCAVGEIQFSPEDCQKYRLCETSNFGSLFGVWKEYSCPEGYHFVLDLKTCLKAENTDCSSKFRLIRQQLCQISILNFILFLIKF